MLTDPEIQIRLAKVMAKHKSYSIMIRFILQYQYILDQSEIKVPIPRNSSTDAQLTRHSGAAQAHHGPHGI